jgi:hypothetical protein
VAFAVAGALHIHHETRRRGGVQRRFQRGAHVRSLVPR